jgi:hypothetical protein
VELVAARPSLLRDDPEYDFTIAALIREHNKESPMPTRTGNWWFNVLAYLQQVAMVSLGCLALLHVSLHTVAFCFLEHLAVAKRPGMSITLDAQSPIHEFGLEHWNHVLNNVFWLLAAAMIVPIVSKASQLGAKADLGQTMLQFGILILVASPMILTIVSRQQRLPKVWATLTDGGKPAKQSIDLYHAQRLWPLDKNWVSKSGILLAFFLLSYFLGVSLSDLMK